MKQRAFNILNGCPDEPNQCKVVQRSISNCGHWPWSGLPYIGRKEPTININQFGSLEPMGMSQHPFLAISNPMAVTAINHSLCL